MERLGCLRRSNLNSTFTSIQWFNMRSDHERSSLSRSSHFYSQFSYTGNPRKRSFLLHLRAMGGLRLVPQLCFELGVLGRELVVMHILFSMFGKFSSACSKWVWKFEQRAFYFGSVEVKLTLACQTCIGRVPNIENVVIMENNQLLIECYVKLMNNSTK